MLTLMKMWRFDVSRVDQAMCACSLFGLLISAYFCPHSVFNSGYLIEFMCLKSDLIDNYDN